MRTNLKENEGITLVALVITIVVLLILAAVAIVALSGENNIITKAQKARDDYNAASVDEGAELSNYERKLSEYTGKGSGNTKDDIGRLVYALFYEDDGDAFEKIIEAGITEYQLDNPLYQMEGAIGENSYDYYKFNSAGDELLVRNGSFISHDQTEIYNEVFAAIELENELKDVFENKNITLDELKDILDNNQLQNYVTTQINNVGEYRDKGDTIKVNVNNVSFEFEGDINNNYKINNVAIYR